MPRLRRIDDPQEFNQHLRCDKTIRKILSDQRKRKASYRSIESASGIVITAMGVRACVERQFSRRAAAVLFKAYLRFVETFGRREYRRSRWPFVPCTHYSGPNLQSLLVQCMSTIPCRFHRIVHKLTSSVSCPFLHGDVSSRKSQFLLLVVAAI